MIGSNHTISVKRLATTDGKEAYDTTIISSIEAYLEPMEAKAAALWSGENALQMHDCFIDDIQDVKVSDLITDGDANEYMVSGVQFYKGGDVPSHTKIACVKQVPIA